MDDNGTFDAEARKLTERAQALNAEILAELPRWLAPLVRWILRI